jgi:hypothetical protein
VLWAADLPKRIFPTIAQSCQITVTVSRIIFLELIFGGAPNAIRIGSLDSGAEYQTASAVSRRAAPDAGIVSGRNGIGRDLDLVMVRAEGRRSKEPQPLG